MKHQKVQELRELLKKVEECVNYLSNENVDITIKANREIRGCFDSFLGEKIHFFPMAKYPIRFWLKAEERNEL